MSRLPRGPPRDPDRQGHSNFATTLIATCFNGRPTFCDGLKRHPAVGRPFEGRGLVQLTCNRCRDSGMKRQFHVLAAGHVSSLCRHRRFEKSVVRRSKQHRFFTIDGRSRPSHGTTGRRTGRPRSHKVPRNRHRLPFATTVPIQNPPTRAVRLQDEWQRCRHWSRANPVS